jgi:two-component system sensor histidine kinase MtrB
VAHLLAPVVAGARRREHRLAVGDRHDGCRLVPVAPRPSDGLLDHRVKAVLRRPMPPTETRPVTGLDAASGNRAQRRAPAIARTRRPDHRARGDGARFKRRPRRARGRGARLSDGGPSTATTSTPDSVPATGEALRAGRRPSAPSGPTPTIAPSRRRAPATSRRRASSSAARSILPSDNNNLYTLYYLFPLDEEQETLALVTRSAADGRGLRCSSSWPG